MSYKEKILFTLRDAANWIPSYNLEKVDTKYGWVGLSGTRVCRQLAEDGYIDKKLEQYVFYKINPKGLAYLEGKESPLAKEFRQEYEQRTQPSATAPPAAQDLFSSPRS